MAPKVWFRLNGVRVPWRPLPASAPGPPPPPGDPADRLIPLALIGSGLRRAELLRVRLGDLGALDAAGQVTPDLAADPLAVAYEQRQGRPRGAPADRVTFLSWPARRAVLDELAHRRAVGGDAGPAAPLVPRREATAAASRQASALIEASRRVNVELCRTTGEFFRGWGLPGSRFVPTGDSGIDSGTDPGTREASGA
jgi:hypothetical protein